MEFSLLKVIPSISEDLALEKYVNKSCWIIAKLAVTEREVEGAWLNLTLSDINKFIYKRINSYSRNKYVDRMFFPSTIIQYIAWENKKIQ